MGAYGEIGRVASVDLSETAKNTGIIVAGRSMEKSLALAKTLKNKKVVPKMIDLGNEKQTVASFREADIVLNCSPYRLNLAVMEACLKAKANYADLGGLYHATKKQLLLHSKFKKAGLTALLGCGSTPGITNVMAAFGAEKFDRVDSIHVQFADKDYTKYTIPFVVPYSMETIFDEFTLKPAVFKNSRTVFVEPLSGKEKIRFPKPVNFAECFYTLHSEVATLPGSFSRKGIKNCSFKGGFDPGFAKKVKFLIDAGLAGTKPITIGSERFSPRAFTEQLLNQFIPGKETKINDIEFLRVELNGKTNGKKKKLVAYCRSSANKEWNFAAGAWNTGAAASVFTQMLAKGFIEQKGTLPPEKCVEPPPFFAELKKRNMKVFIAGR